MHALPLPPYKALFIAIIFASLFGCATTKTPPANNPASLIEHWRFEGKVGLRQNNKAQSAFIKWRQDAENFQIELHGPFGKGRTTIEKTHDQVRMYNNDRELVADSAEALFTRATGMNMPVSYLQWWLKGLGAPNSDILAPLFDDIGRLQAFTQGQWRIQIQRFANVDGYSLPEKLTVTNTDYRLTLVIKTWEITPIRPQP